MRKSAAKKSNQNVAVASEPATTPENLTTPAVTETAEIAAPAASAANTPAPEAIAPIAEALAEPVVEKPAKGKESKEKKVVPKKPKLVRDSFTFPETDYAQIAALKQRALDAGREIKKGEVLRAGLAVLSGLSDSDLLSALDSIDKLKPGRPAK